jgi:hypothetical protein
MAYSIFFPISLISLSSFLAKMENFFKVAYLLAIPTYSAKF